MGKVRILAVALILCVGGFSFAADGPAAKPSSLDEQIKVLQIQVETLQKLLKLSDQQATIDRKGATESTDAIVAAVKDMADQLDKLDARVKAMEAKQAPTRGK